MLVTLQYNEYAWLIKEFYSTLRTSTSLEKRFVRDGLHVIYSNINKCSVTELQKKTPKNNLHHLIFNKPPTILVIYV